MYKVVVILCCRCYNEQQQKIIQNKMPNIEINKKNQYMKQWEKVHKRYNNKLLKGELSINIKMYGVHIIKFVRVVIVIVVGYNWR